MSGREDDKALAAYLLGEASVIALKREGLELLGAKPTDGWVLVRHTRTGTKFLMTIEPFRPCPECSQGKCQNCDGSIWDNDADELTDCPCATRDHKISGV